MDTGSTSEWRSLIDAEKNLFFIALGFFSRIPVPRELDFSQEKLNQASRYFSLVGWIIGLICALTYYLFALVLPEAVAIILSMLASILITGGFHEDGLADTADGFGGGWDKTQKLNIMKDSRLGTYGALALWFALSLKLVSLSQIQSVFVALLVAHPISRATATTLIYTLPYVTEDKKSKVKPLAESHDKKDLYINLAITLPALFICTFVFGMGSTLIIAAGFVIALLAMHHLLKKQLGGFTGDTLGATQQVCELVIFICILGTQG